ncbi:hypothetical protein C5O72_00390 [Muribaculum intestinale]|uniref:Uncharacterized protein n=1 Tax=Muribaculum intestinale TaxID=1796646 RepID=A0A1B1S6H2_9BACT|nr:hypothetical protein A4V02_00580 [Muribaculum intestinale]ASB37129.1 hypothetical protein ADH68_03490 [Muribaculum intestinale]PWB04590.1 hypothetical protein C5O29_04430 [Muribaculum intestinale]PWB12425.1 hypothetical protein C5O72_00390 [Muribaculum intestinale]
MGMGIFVAGHVMMCGIPHPANRYGACWVGLTSPRFMPGDKSKKEPDGSKKRDGVSASLTHRRVILNQSIKT